MTIAMINKGKHSIGSSTGFHSSQKTSNIHTSGSKTNLANDIKNMQHTRQILASERLLDDAKNINSITLSIYCKLYQHADLPQLGDKADIIRKGIKSAHPLVNWNTS